MALGVLRVAPWHSGAAPTRADGDAHTVGVGLRERLHCVDRGTSRMHVLAARFFMLPKLDVAGGRIVLSNPMGAAVNSPPMKSCVCLVRGRRPHTTYLLPLPPDLPQLKRSS